MSKPIRPSSIDSIKRLAKAIKAEDGVTHTEALNLAARRGGFQSFTHARHQLEFGAEAPPEIAFPKRPNGGPKMGHDAFLDQCRAAWVQTLDILKSGQDDRRTWTSPAAIRATLSRMLAHTRSHAHLPTGGGLDFLSVQSSSEGGVLKFQVERSSTHLARPKSLTLEWIARRPAESFLLLELETLEPSGVYEREETLPEDPSSAWLKRREEVLELSPGKYVERWVWDQGYLDLDEQGREIPLPEDANLVTRWFDGKILFVTKGSMWNGTSATYDGRHDTMCPDQIRAMIERSLPKDLATE